MAKFTATVVAKSVIEADNPRELFEQVSLAMERMEEAASDHGIPEVELIDWPPCVNCGAAPTVSS